MSDGSETIRLAIGADHGGYELKEHLKKWLGGRVAAVEDCGTFDGATADYPRIAAAVAEKVAAGACERGIIIDGAGIGSSMTANKFPGVRAALCYDVSSARNAREHNDANVLTLGARLIGVGLAEQIVDAFLTVQCTEERHRKRVGMIGEIERSVRGGATCGCGAGQGSADAKTPTPSVPHPSPLPKGEGIRRDHLAKGEAAGLATLSELSNLSPEDLERIARRIVELGGLPSGCTCGCCGPTCTGTCASRDPATMRGLIGMGVGRIGHGLGGGPIAKDVSQFIDHTLLKPEATAQQITQLCKEAAEFGFASVCINPSYVSLAARLLRGTSVAVCTVAGFPLGAHVNEIKAMEARRAIREGAREVDMVINIGALKSGDDELVYRDIRGVVEACEEGRALCKVIIECVLLTDEEKVRACLAAKRARADFVKTSTGFASGGATAHDVALMAEVVRGTGMGVKAAGGIRSYKDVQAMVEAGATRIGASAGVAIVKEAKGSAPVTTGGAGRSADKY